ncbi:MAG: hypothetical protein ACREF6_09325 [Alphaproteobacteria bacterium]
MDEVDDPRLFDLAKAIMRWVLVIFAALALAFATFAVVFLALM